jgi:hypothetical protein
VLLCQQWVVETACQTKKHSLFAETAEKRADVCGNYSKESEEFKISSNLITKGGLDNTIFIALENVIFAWNATPDKVLAAVFVLLSCASHHHISLPIAKRPYEQRLYPLFSLQQLYIP